MKNKMKSTQHIFIGLLSFFLLWEVMHIMLNTHTVPSPLGTIEYTIGHLIILVKHSMASILRVVIAISISLLVACPIGIIIATNKTIKKLFTPLLYFIYPIPKVAFLPVFMILFGLGNLSKVMLVIWIIVFQIILSVRDGVEQIEPLYFKVMESYLSSKKQIYRYLIIPAILQSIFTGLRISIGIALASLFFAENYATTYGIGYYILSAWTKMNYEEMFSGILALGFVGIFLFKILDAIEHRTAPWRN